MASNKIPCGGFYFDPEQFEIAVVDGKPVLQVKLVSSEGVTGNYYPMTKDGKATIDLNLDGHSIRNAGGISTNGAHPVHFGATVFPKGTVGVKVTSTNNDELAVVKPETINEYVPVNVGEPTIGSHAATRNYVEESIREATESLQHEIDLLKAKVTELEKNHPKP